MSLTATVATPHEPALSNVPPLMNGDRLTRREFERRYEHMPEDVRAELIEGKVYMASPVRLDTHGEQHAFIITWLGVYAAATLGIRIGDNATVRLDADNEPQPDALLMLPNGAARIGAAGYVEGPPELAFEIAASSAAYDLHEKRDVYRRNGVQEYAVWQIYERKIEWWALEDEMYTPLPIENGIIRSRVFPGLWLNAPAMLHGDMATVLATLQQGIASAEHATFRAGTPRTPPS